MSQDSESTLEAYEESFAVCAAFNIYGKAKQLLQETFPGGASTADKSKFLHDRLDQLLRELDRDTVVQDFADTVRHEKAYILFKKGDPFGALYIDAWYREAVVRELAGDYVTECAVPSPPKKIKLQRQDAFTGVMPRRDDTLVLTPAKEEEHLKTTLKGLVSSAAQAAAEITAEKLFNRLKQLKAKQAEEEEEVEEDIADSPPCIICNKPNDRHPKFDRCSGCYHHFRPTYRPRGVVFDWDARSYRPETDQELENAKAAIKEEKEEDTTRWWRLSQSPKQEIKSEVNTPLNKSQEDIFNITNSDCGLSDDGSLKCPDNQEGLEEFFKLKKDRRAFRRAVENLDEEHGEVNVCRKLEYPDTPTRNEQEAAFEEFTGSPIANDKATQTSFTGKENEPPICVICGHDTLHRSYVCVSHKNYYNFGKRF